LEAGGKKLHVSRSQTLNRVGNWEIYTNWVMVVGPGPQPQIV